MEQQNYYLYIAQATVANLFLVNTHLKRLVIKKNTVQVTQHFLLEYNFLYPVVTSRNMAKKSGNYSCASIRIKGPSCVGGGGGVLATDM